MTLHKVVCLSSEFIYAGKYTSKQVRIPSISFWCNHCLKATFKWTLQYVFIQGKQKGEQIFSPQKFLSWVPQSLLQWVLLLPWSMTGQPEKAKASFKSFTYLMSPSVFWGGRRKGENTNKHYFQILGTLHNGAEGQTCKAICMSTSGGFSSGELQFCRPAAVLPTNFDCSYCNNQTSFALPCRNIKRIKK